jgi:hypothetical protein
VHEIGVSDTATNSCRGQARADCAPLVLEQNASWVMAAQGSVEPLSVEPLHRQPYAEAVHVLEAAQAPRACSSTEHSAELRYRATE